MVKRKFHFPLSVLSGAVFATAMADRLNADTDTATNRFATRFAAKTAALDTGDSSQRSKPGQAGSLTRGQNADFAEMEHPLAGTRGSARLAFPGDNVKLHNEFQVGQRDPDTLDAELERSRIVLNFCLLPEYVAPLKVQSWLPKDTSALNAAIEKFSGSTLAKDDALGDRIGLTSEKTVAANAVYEDALRIQNAVRLEYPANKPGTEAARARFLLEEFPPRDRSEPSGGTQTPTSPTDPVEPTP